MTVKNNQAGKKLSRNDMKNLTGGKKISCAAAGSACRLGVTDPPPCCPGLSCQRRPGGSLSVGTCK